MSTNSLLTPCKQGAVLSRYSILLGTFTLLPGLGNENELRTHTLQARCGTFTLLQYFYKYGINPQLNHADGEALTLQFLDSLTNGFVVLGGYA